MAVDLIVPLKRPSTGKSRLRGVLKHTGTDATGDAGLHAELVLALAYDTLRATVSTPGVRRILVVGSDPAALSTLRELGVDVVGEPSETGAADGLNAALRAGERLLRATAPDAVVGALQADLPALRPEELSAALTEARGTRAFVADRQGTGTTLLLSAPGARLRPRFGPGSAHAHTLSGARPITAPVPSLRGDVDTPGDLDHARLLGLGERTRAVLDRACLLS